MADLTRNRAVRQQEQGGYDEDLIENGGARQVSEASNFFLDKFLGAFGPTGPAKANRFRVDFSLPKGIAESGVFTNTNSEESEIRRFESSINRFEQVSTLCHTCTMPSREINTTAVGQWGPPHRMPLTSMYMPVSFSFYTGYDFAIREFFEVWQAVVCNISSNTFNFYNEFTSDIRINILDQYGKVPYYIDLYEAWPSSVGTIDLAYSNNDNLANVTVVMQYKYWANSRDDTRIASTTGGSHGTSF